MWHDTDEPRSGTLPDPPIDAWERAEALRELSRLARNVRLERDDAESVSRRLGRLTGSQRAAIAEAMERILEIGS